MYVNSPVLLCSSYSTPPLAPLTDRNKPAVWAATPREAGRIYSDVFGFFWKEHDFKEMIATKTSASPAECARDEPTRKSLKTSQLF